VKSTLGHLLTALLYLALLGGMVYYYYGEGRMLIARFCYGVTADGRVAGFEAQSFGEFVKESEQYVQGTVRELSIKILLIIVFAFLGIAMLGQIALASSAGPLKRLTRYVASVRAGKPRKGNELKKGEKFYGIYSDITQMVSGLEARERELADVAARALEALGQESAPAKEKLLRIQEELKKIQDGGKPAGK
jgi:hypothetical protein